MKKRTIYIGLCLIFIIGVISLIGTFAIDTTITEGNSSKADYLFNITLGDRTDREIIIPSYDSKIVDIKVSNPNNFKMSYLLYLDGTNSNISITNIGDVDANGVIASKTTSVIKTFVQNNSGSDITIKIRDIVGFEKEALSKPSGSTSINKGPYYKVVVKPNNNEYGSVKPNIKLSASNGVVKYTLTSYEGYEYKSNTCGGTVSNNVLTISNITGNISCQVLFGLKRVNVTLNLAGGTLSSGSTYYTVTYTQPYGTLPTPTKTDYEFVGWYTGENGTGTKVTSSTIVTNTNSHTLYAKWKEACKLPTFTYTGTYEIVDDSNNTITNISSYVGNWKIRFLSSGTLTFSNLGCAKDGIDTFIVGGGGAGAIGSNYVAQDTRGGGGGGGGAAITVSRLTVSTSTSYSIVVGGSTENSSFGAGNTAYFTALGGNTAVAPAYNYGWSNPAGVGGAGRLSSETNNYGAIDVVAMPGGAGNGADGNYEFNETGNRRYGAGGGGGGDGVSTSIGGYGGAGIAGGADGGGTGGKGCSFAYNNNAGKYQLDGAYAGTAGTANTGSGGGGGGSACGSGSSSSGSRGAGGAGGSGIVIIRNTRTNETNPPVGTLTATKSYNTISASINATDDTGIDHYEYYLSTSSTCPTTGYTTSSSNTNSFEVTNTGTYYVCARVVDLLGNVLSLKSNSFSVSRVYKVAIRYNTNGGTITRSSGGYTWTTDSTGLIYQNGSVYEQSLYYGKTIDLANYNNSSFINIGIGDLYVLSGSEWVCLSGCSNIGKTYSQDIKYSSSDFCDLTSSNCTVVLGLRIVEDITPPTCTISANSTTITAVPADDKGVAKLSYYGWDSSFSGSNSTTKPIGVGTYTYYVKDGSNNTATCSISIESTVDGCVDGYGLTNDGGQCYYSYNALPNYEPTGSCTCRNDSHNNIPGSCSVTSWGSVSCACPNGASINSNGCGKTVTSYSCSRGGQHIGYACYFYDDVIQVCPSGYTEISNSNYCYK